VIWFLNDLIVDGKLRGWIVHNPCSAKDFDAYVQVGDLWIRYKWSGSESELKKDMEVIVGEMA
jgi:hypothetical protein